MPSLGLKNNLAVSSSGVVRGNDYWVAMDGDADYINLSSSFNNIFDAKDWSISAWIYHIGDDTAVTSGLIFSTGSIVSGNTFRFKIQNDKLNFYFGTSGTVNVDYINGTASSALNDYTWYHVGLTHDDSAETIKIYVNGSVTDTFTSKNVPGVVHDTNARIGSLAESGTSGELYGRIANVAIFGDLVTSGEMSNLASVHSYDATSIGNCVGWWRMGAGTEAGSGTTIYDMSALNNHGTLIGDAAIQKGTIE
tara:strand:- start:1111 stop:1863 length:753 start_codon:yes stop_codon:yes gene_type:complete